MTHALPGREQTAARQRPAATPITDAIAGAYKRTVWSLVLRGLLSLAAGIFILARPIASVAAFALIVALWALIDGFTNIVRAFAMRDVVSHWWVMLLAGVVSVIFGGAALYYYPSLSLAFAVVWTSLWVLTAGAMAVYVAVQEKRIGVSWGWTMFLGLLGIAAGIACYVFPGVTLSVLMGFIAAFGILGGIALLVAAGKLRSVKQSVTRPVQEPPI